MKWGEFILTYVEWDENFYFEESDAFWHRKAPGVWIPGVSVLVILAGRR